MGRVATRRDVSGSLTTPYQLPLYPRGYHLTLSSNTMCVLLKPLFITTTRTTTITMNELASARPSAPYSHQR